jgi:arylsulfatase
MQLAKRLILTTVFALALSMMLAPTARAQEVLPFPPTPSASIAGRTMQESAYKQRVEPRRLPADAPNILIVLIDDVGPGQPNTYGGEIYTPTLSRIAQEGISYNRFHTTAMCSPTRASLLTGRNHHRVGTDLGSPVSLDYFDAAPFKFNGTLDLVHVKYTGPN